MIKIPYEEIDQWLKGHFSEILEKMKESAKNGYQTYTDDNINVTNSYSGDPFDIGFVCNNKLSLPGNETDVLLYYEPSTKTIHINSLLALKTYKTKESLYSAILEGLIHELTHASDPGRKFKKNDYTDYSEYVNNDVEFPAFVNMFINKLKNKIRDGKLDVDTIASAVRSGKNIPDKETASFMNNLNDDNRRKFIKYIYKEIIEAAV